MSQRYNLEVNPNIEATDHAQEFNKPELDVESSRLTAIETTITAECITRVHDRIVCVISKIAALYVKVEIALGIAVMSLCHYAMYNETLLTETKKIARSIYAFCVAMSGGVDETRCGIVTYCRCCYIIALQMLLYYSIADAAILQHCRCCYIIIYC